jgi:hypothetical protein
MSSSDMRGPAIRRRKEHRPARGGPVTCASVRRRRALQVSLVITARDSRQLATTPSSETPRRIQTPNNSNLMHQPHLLEHLHSEAKFCPAWTAPR